MVLVRPEEYDDDWYAEFMAYLDDLEALAGAGTNLAATLSAANTIITSDTGTDATIPAVDATNAGVMTPTQRAKLEGTTGAIFPVTATQTLATALAAAVANGGGTILFTKAASPHTIASQVQINNNNIWLDAEPGAVINYTSAISNNAGIKFAGSRSVALGTVSSAANVLKNATTITLGAGQGANFAAGDLIVIKSSGEIFNAIRPTTDFKGEFARVLSVAGDVLTLRGPTFDSYLTSAYTVTVDKITPLTNVGIRNLNIVGTTNNLHRQTGVEFLYCFDPRAENCQITGTMNIGIRFMTCYLAAATYNVLTDIRQIADAGNGIEFGGYGVLAYGSQGVLMHGNVGVRCRHAVDSDSHSPEPVARNILMESNRAYDCWSAPISTHGGSEYITIRGNHSWHSWGGLSIRARYTNCEGNFVHGMNDTSGGLGGGQYHGLIIGEDVGALGFSGTGIKVVNNRFDCSGPSGVTSHAIYSLDPLNNAIIAQNQALGFTSHGFYLRGLTSRDVWITDNIIDATSQTGTSHALYMKPSTTADGNNQKNINIARNRFKGGSHIVTRVEGNTVAGANASTDIRFDDNEFSGGTWEYVYLKDGFYNNCLIRRNNFIDKTFTNAIGITAANHAVYPRISENTFIGQNYGLVGSGTAVPTTGTWKIGDIVVNQTPSSLGVAYWVCVAPGTPGTWEAVATTGEVNTALSNVLTNSTTAIQYFTGTTKVIPAASVVAGKAFRLQARGVFTTTAVTTTLFTVALEKAGPTTVPLIAQTAAFTNVAATDRLWTLDLIFTVVTKSATGTAEAHGVVQLFTNTNAVTSLEMRSGTAAASPPAYGAVTGIDWNSDQTIKIGITFGATGSTHRFHVRQFTIEPLN